MVAKKEREQEGRLPFCGLDGLVRQAGLKLQPDSEPEKEPEPPEQPPPAQPEDSDEDAFRLAMDGVARRTLASRPCPLASARPSATASDPELEDRRLMQAALEGDPALTVQDHPEYIEGWVGLGGPRYLPSCAAAGIPYRARSTCTG